MIKSLLAIIFVSIAFGFHSQNLIWAKSFGGYGSDKGNALAIDGNGNVYTAGSFEGVVDFDPGAGTTTLSSLGLKDVFVTKSDASGNFIWAKSLGGSSQDEALGIAIDVFGGVYLTGFFNAIVDFDPGAGTNLLGSNGNADAFILKLDGSGNFVWVNPVGAGADDVGNEIAIDASGDVIVAGSFQNVVDFNQSAAFDTLTSFGQTDIFVAKYNPSGNFVWAKKMGGASADLVSAMTLGGGGNVFITGLFSGTADFDPSSFTYTLNAIGNDIFIAKLDVLGNFYWSQQITGNPSGNRTAKAIASDGNGNIYTAGSFNNVVDFDSSPATATLSSAGLNDDVFVLKINSSGNFVWVKQIGAASTESANGMDVDAVGNVYLNGSFLGTVDFDPSADLHNFSSSSAPKTDIFILKLSTAGNYVWAAALGGIENDIGNKIKVDAAGKVYATGIFQFNADMDPSTSVTYITSNGNNDVFVIKLNQNPLPSTNLIENELNDSFSVFPNPTKDVLKIDIAFPLNLLSLTDINGTLMISASHSNQIDISALRPGIYFLKISGENSLLLHKKIIKE